VEQAAATAREIVETALRLLRTDYVFPGLAERAAAAIEVQLAASDYDGMNEAARADLLTSHRPGDHRRHVRRGPQDSGVVKPTGRVGQRGEDHLVSADVHLGVGLTLLLAITLAALTVAGVGQRRAVLLAAIRAGVQLTLMAAELRGVFAAQATSIAVSPSCSPSPPPPPRGACVTGFAVLSRDCPLVVHGKARPVSGLQSVYGCAMRPLLVAWVTRSSVGTLS